GLKAIDAHGMEMRREDEESIEAILFEDRFHAAAWSDVGSSRVDDTAIPRYMEAIEAKVDAEAIRKRNPMVVVDPGNGAGSVVTPVSTSSVVEDVVRASGGKLIRTRVGSPIVARAMFESGAVFGGEENGGVIFPDHQFCRDGAMSAAKMLELLAHEGKSLSALVAELPQYHIKKANVEVPVERREAVLAAIVELAKGR